MTNSPTWTHTPSTKGLAAVALLLALANPAPLHAQARVNSRVSVGSDAIPGTASGAQGNEHSLAPALTPDGRFVAFTSRALNLVPGDTNSVDDIFVRDRATGVTERVSTSASGQEANGPSGRASISADGRFVAFSSAASNLAPGDAAAFYDVFVKDRQTGTVQLVSKGIGGVAANGGSYYPTISADGRLVSFVSDAGNLVAGDTNGLRDAFVRDLQANATDRVSVGPGGAQANGPTWYARMSGDGSKVVFASTASNLALSDANNSCDDRADQDFPLGLEKLQPDHQPNCQDVFLRDRGTQTTELVSISSAGVQGSTHSAWPVISADGRFVAFATYSDFTGDGSVRGDRAAGSARVYRVDLVTRGWLRVSDWAYFPTLSGDGRFVGYGRSNANAIAGLRTTFEPALRDVFATEISLAPRATQDFTEDSVAVTGISDTGDVAFATGRVLNQADSNARYDVYVSSVRPTCTLSLSPTTVTAPLGGASGTVAVSTSSGDCAWAVFSEASWLTVTEPVAMAGLGSRSVAYRVAASTSPRVARLIIGEREVVFSQGATPPPPPSASRPVLTLPGADPALDHSGRHLAFVSASAAVVPGDTNGVADVFVRDRASNRTVRVSVGPNGVQANGASERPRISADGRFVAFQSGASNLVAGDTNGVTDVFVHDRDTDQDGTFDEPGGVATRRVSVSSTRMEANGSSHEPDISPDGQWVAFASAASTLVPGDTNGVTDVFLHHWPSGQTTRVSMSSDGVQADADSRAPQVSARGRLVVFASDATTLVADDTNQLRDVFVHDRVDAKTVRMSVGPGGVQANGASDAPSIDAAGTTIAVETTATNLVAGVDGTLTQIVLYRLPAATPLVTSGIVREPVVDIGAAIRRLMSQNASQQPGNGHSTQPDVSDSGNAVAFTSEATNVVPGDTNGQPDVFVTTVDAGATGGAPQRMTVDDTGNQPTTPSRSPAVSGDGRFTSFESDAVTGSQGPPVSATNVVVWGAPLLVGSVTPRHAVVNTQPAVVIDGSGFVAGTTVRFGTSASPKVVIESSTKLIADVPPASTPALVDLTITLPDGTAQTLPQAFTYTAAAVTADADGDGLPDEWEQRFGLNPSVASGDEGAAGDPDADGLTNAQEHQGATHPRGVFARFFAEGATGPLFTTQLALVNPATSTPAQVQVRALKADGTVSRYVTTLAPHSRLTLNAADDLQLRGAEFSTVVEADAPLVVDRTMTWDPTRYGAHAETAVPAPALTWYLAEGATHSGFDLFYLLQNPNAVEAQVRVRFLRPTGAPLEKTYTLPPTSRTNIWVDVESFPGLGAALASTDVSAVFEVLNLQPIIVERAMYLEVPGQTLGAGHESAGITTPATTWFLAEGATGPYFDLFVLVANPGPVEATVEATYLLPDGTTMVKRYTVQGNSRFNIWVDSEVALLADTAVSTTIRSTNAVPIIVERAMWWPGSGWYEAHNSPGSTGTGTAWALAEGEVDASRNLETYILVANTSAAPADVKVTLLFEDGTTAEQTYVGLPARSRFNVPVGGFFPEAAGRRFGAIVESLGEAPAQIVVERAMYWDAAGQRWAAGTNALATRLQ